MGTAVEMLAAGAIMLLLSVLFGERMPGAPTRSSALALLYLIVRGSLVAFSAYTYLLRHVSPALATSFAYVNPVVAVALGGEHVTPIELVATPVILGGVVLVILGRTRTAQ